MYKTLLFVALTLSGHFLAAQKTSVPAKPGTPGLLRYPLPDSIRAVTFYNELTVPARAVTNPRYYVACGFAGGYLGLQGSSAAEKKVIFSVGNSGPGAISKKPVADSRRIQLLAKGEQVVAGDPGNKRTGTQSHLAYSWKPGATYPFMVTALTDSAAATTTYTGYFFIPEIKKWKLIASFKVPDDGLPLHNLYAFNDHVAGGNDPLKQKDPGGNQWVQDERGRWIELTQSLFGDDMTVNGIPFNRTATGQKPVINWSGHADSAGQAQTDQALIFRAIKEQKADTTGSRNGVYYQILKEGTGQFVAATDTVTVFYKGSLLSDGSVFDQTRDQPATFPLSRLIKGWQLALPACKVGGTIRIIIPSGLAYTIRSRSNAIPPNSVLVFDIEVLAAKPSV